MGQQRRGLSWCPSTTHTLPPPPQHHHLLTLTLLLAHDRVTEGEQAEKLVGARVARFHRLQQGVVVETEVWVCQGVEGSEVQLLQVHKGAV